MPIRVTDYLSLNKQKFDATGAFDTILDVDTKLYISPLLLHEANVPELSESYKHIQKHFEKIMLLLRVSQEPGDRLWREASKHLRFQEPKWLPLGYSGSGTAGRGIGQHVQAQLTRAAKEIIDAGVDEPEIFELIGLLEENIGPDLISDMVGSIILRHLLHYSVRVFSELGVSSEKLSSYTYQNEKLFLPSYSGNRKSFPIVLIPRTILKPLPIMTTWDDIDSVAAKNLEVRQQMNEIIGEAWSRVRAKDKKRAFKKVLLHNPKLFEELIKDYRVAPPETYDFLEDSEGFVKWIEAARIYTQQHPLTLELTRVASKDDVFDVVLKICHKFRTLVEDNGLSKELYNEKTLKPRREETSQKLLFAIADSYCEANNIDLTRESDAGRGPVDFKFSPT